MPLLKCPSCGINHWTKDRGSYCAYCRKARCQDAADRARREEERRLREETKDPEAGREHERKKEALAEGRSLRDEGKALAAEVRAATLKHAQGVAKELSADDLAEDQRGITIDDVRDHMLYDGDNPNDLGNAAGSVFKGKGWKRVGSVQSKRPAAHARWISVWIWEGANETS